MPETFLDRIDLHCGDCLAVLAALPDNSIDSCVTDPPYHLTSIVKRFGSDDAAPPKEYTSAPYGGNFPYRDSGGGTGAAFARMSKGFMGKVWDGGDIAFRPEVWMQIYRVLKPGGYVLAFGGTRTYHRMACAIEDAGFDVRDMISWIYGSGFPKSHDVSKGIDRAAGAERDVVGQRELWGSAATGGRAGQYANGEAPKADGSRKPLALTTASTDAARQWDGWGTALKPALEPICMARKPLSENTVAANVLEHGTGAINVDGCRVAGEVNPSEPYFYKGENGQSLGDDQGHLRKSGTGANSTLGRWPANVIHDGSEEVVGMFPDSDGAVSNGRKGVHGLYEDGIGSATQAPSYGDSGSAARFFYSAKADADDRLGSKHPTVKPVDLMQYLVRLITPPHGTVIDPFAGTGTTGEAAWREGMHAVLIEAEPEYQNDIRRRMKLCMAGPDERARETMKAKLEGKPRDDGPLFNRESWSEMWAKPFDFSSEPKGNPG